MPASYTQTNRFLGLKTVLGQNDLLVRSFSGSEGISRPFHFELELISENDSIDLEKLIGTSATLRVALADGSPRPWNGYITRITQGRRGPVFTSYHAEMVPWLWFLGLRLNSRIFQAQTTPDIVSAIFNELGYKDFKFKLKGTPPKRDYCVQYRETDLNFVMRLMEEEGIFFFFEHTNDRHTLVAANSPDAHPVCDNQSSVQWRTGTGGRLDEDFVEEWQYEKQFVSSGSALGDFNFQTPAQSLLTKVTGDTPLEIYDQPGNYSDKKRGATLNRVRLEEIQVAGTEVRGHGNCRSFSAGHRFKLRNHYRSEWNRSYVLTEVGHSASQAGNFMGDETAADGDTAYQNSFTCIPYNTAFRPLRRSPVPVVEGCQTAIVVGPAGEEIYTDEFGRIKVQFHWDRDGTKNEKSSCWIRVAQSWAGKGWGVIAIPRIGQEVVVDFLEGNPDRPIVTGSVYNAQTTVPYGLPSNKDMTGIRSNSTKDAEGYNEIVFKDATGAELVRMRAQRDMSTQVNHDETISIGHNRSEHVGMNETVTVNVLRTHNVGVNDMLNVGGGQEVSVGGAQAVSVGLARTVTVGLSQNTDIGKNYLLEAGDSIVLKTGSSSITLKKDGTIVIEGKDITHKASGNITGKASGDIILKGSKIANN